MTKNELAITTSNENNKKSEKNDRKALDDFVSVIEQNMRKFISNTLIEMERTWFSSYIIFMLIFSTVASSICFALGASLGIGTVTYYSIVNTYLYFF